jgi:hypothetical protein
MSGGIEVSACCYSSTVHIAGLATIIHWLMR